MHQLLDRPRSGHSETSTRSLTAHEKSTVSWDHFIVHMNDLTRCLCQLRSNCRLQNIRDHILTNNQFDDPPFLMKLIGSTAKNWSSEEKTATTIVVSFHKCCTKRYSSILMDCEERY